MISSLRKALILASIGVTLSLSAKAQIFTSGVLALDGSNIENNGNIIAAIKFTGTDATIGTVNFTAENGIQTDNNTPAVGDHFTLNGNGIDGTGGGANKSDAVWPLIQDGVYNNNGVNITLTLTGLIAGQTYAAQVIFDANSSDVRTDQLEDITAGTVNPPTSDEVGTGGGLNTPAGTGPGPIYITDTFTATGSTETLHNLWGGGNGGQISGFVLETVAVPEPSTWAMMGLSLAGLVLFLHKRASLRS